jgi:hypothetical protein
MHHRAGPLVLSLATIALSTAACTQQGEAGRRSPDSQAELPINQSQICEVSGWQHDVTSKACKPGQKVVFLPSRWGNEQLPILFAAVNCDLRYSVVLTNGGATCIYNPITPAAQPKQAPEPSTEQPKQAPEPAKP